MPVRSNRYFNDPGLAAAASNLSAMFAPPSGSDAFGWAKANATREEASRLAELFAASQRPEFDQQAFDRGNIAVGTYAPTQSYYKVGVDDATNRRGQDITATTDRRGQDIAAATSRSNNAADNKRAAITGLYGELAPGEIRPAVPAEIMDAIGLPGIGQTEGRPAMPSKTEWEAAQAQRLLESGQLNDTDLVNTIIGDQTPVQAVGPDGRGMFMTPGAAVRSGAEPYDKPSGTPRMYRTRDGSVGRTQDGLTDMVTGLPVPADAIVGTVSDTSESFGSSELARARETLIEGQAGVDSMIGQLGKVDEMLAQAGVGSAVGVLGSAANFLNSAAAQAEELARVAGVDIEPNIRDVARYEQTFREAGITNARLQSAYIDLAFTIAQAQGNDRITEADVQKAMQTLGATGGDPRAMRILLRDVGERTIERYNANFRARSSAYGDQLGIAPREFQNLTPLEGAAAPPAPSGSGGNRSTKVERWGFGPDGTLQRVE